MKAARHILLLEFLCMRDATSLSCGNNDVLLKSHRCASDITRFQVKT